MTAKQPLNPDWVKIARELAVSYQEIHAFAVDCRSYDIPVPDAATIRVIFECDCRTGLDAASAWIALKLQSIRERNRESDVAG